MKFTFIEYIHKNDSPDLELFVDEKEYEYIIDKSKEAIRNVDFLGYYLRREKKWFDKISDHKILAFWMIKFNQRYTESNEIDSTEA